MIFHVLAAVTAAGMIMTSTSCAQRERDTDQESDVFVTSTERRAWLGVSVEDMSDRLARRMNIKTEKGALVNSVSDDSPAEKAGIKEDDIIVSFNGKPIEDAGDLTSAVGKAEPGKSVECVVMRRNDRKTIQVTPAKPPKALTVRVPRVPRAPLALMGPGHFSVMGGGALGLGVMDLNRQLAEYFEISGGRGVLVTEVEKDGPGAKAGLKAGDVIVSAGTVDVDDIDDIHWALSNFKGGDTITIGYVRKGARKSTTVTINEASHPNIYRFRSEAVPDIDVDIDLEGLKEMRLDLKKNQLELQQELERVRKESQAAGREARREAERAVREARRAMSGRTI
jgi:C-terminal processing protease CtpA/Prc